MKKILFFFLCAASSSAFCAPGISIISGERTEPEITQAVKERASWFDRAIANCISKTRKSCDIVIELQLAPGATTPTCRISSHDIKPDAVAALYCKVGETLAFTKSGSASAFTLAFERSTETAAPEKGLAIGAGQHATAAMAAPVAATPEEKLAPKAAPITAGHPDFVPVSVSARIPLPEKPTVSCEGPGKVRDSEAVRQCFDQFGGMLGRIYARELRDNPLLGGSFKMTITIEPDGQVSKLTGTLTSGTISTALAQQLVDTVAGINFGAASQQVTLNHDLNFYPN